MDKERRHVPFRKHFVARKLADVSDINEGLRCRKGQSRCYCLPSHINLHTQNQNDQQQPQRLKFKKVVVDNRFPPASSIGISPVLRRAADKHRELPKTVALKAMKRLQDTQVNGQERVQRPPAVSILANNRPPIVRKTVTIQENCKSPSVKAATWINSLERRRSPFSKTDTRMSSSDRRKRKVAISSSPLTSKLEQPTTPQVTEPNANLSSPLTNRCRSYRDVSQREASENIHVQAQKSILRNAQQQLHSSTRPLHSSTRLSFDELSSSSISISDFTLDGLSTIEHLMPSITTANTATNASSSSPMSYDDSVWNDTAALASFNLSEYPLPPQEPTSKRNHQEITDITRELRNRLKVIVRDAL